MLRIHYMFVMSCALRSFPSVAFYFILLAPSFLFMAEHFYLAESQGQISTVFL